MVQVSLSGVPTSLLPPGVGVDVTSARYDLGRKLERLVRTHRNVPPHARKPENREIEEFLNRLIDWGRYDRENPFVEPPPE